LKIEFMDAIIDKLEGKRLDAGGKSDAEHVKTYFDAEISTLEVQNFMGIRGTRLVHFHVMKNGVYYVTGINGSGKSTLVESITWCLFGEMLRADMKAGDPINDDAREVDSKESKCRVTIIFKNGYKITRNREERRKNATHLWIETPDGTRVEKAKIKDTQLEVECLLGIDFETYARTVLLSSTTTLNFINSDDKSKRLIIERLLGCEKFGEYDEAAKEEKKVRDNEKKKFDNELGKIAEDKRFKENDITNCIDRTKRKANENDDVKRSLTVMESRLTSLEHDSISNDRKRNEMKIQLDKMKEDNAGLQLTINNGNVTCMELREMKTLHDTARDAHSKLASMETNQKSMMEQLRLNKEKSSLDSIVSSMKDIKEKHIDTMNKDFNTLALSSRIDNEIVSPLKSYIDSNQGANTSDSRRLVDIRNIEVKLVLIGQDIVLFRKQVPMYQAKLDAYLDARGWSDASIELTRMEELQKNLVQYVRTKERMDISISELYRAMPPTDEAMLETITLLKKSIESKRIKIECNLADMDAEKLTQASIQPMLDDFDKQIQFLIDTKGADIKRSMDIANFWVAALCPGKMKQANGFRSFCLGKQMENVNRLLSENMELMCEDVHGVVSCESIDLSCELTENLQVVEKGKGVAIQKRSEGQRRRTHLAIFLTLFTIAQRRLSFHPSFLFLDEVFDSLDEPGQASVQKWVNSLLTQARNPISKVFVITHSHVRVPSSKNGGTILVTTQSSTGSNYEVIDAKDNDDIFVSSHGYRFNKRKRDEFEHENDDDNDVNNNQYNQRVVAGSSVSSNNRPQPVKKQVKPRIKK
jgi:DNA repair exonuclease SbcCD ATPase subunit